MQRVLLLLIIICPLMIISCSQGVSPADQIRQLNTSDTFYFEENVPGYFTDSAYHHIKSNSLKYNNLNPINKGFDSIEIRIDYGGAMTGYRIVILRNKNNEWSALASRDINEVKSGVYDTLKLEYWDWHTRKRVFENKTPKSGWDRFIKGLFRYNILTLLSENKIEYLKKRSVNDGVGVFIEIATKKLYRCYYLNEPDMYFTESSEAKNYCLILDLIDRELGLLPLWEYKNDKPITAKKIKKVKEVELLDAGDSGYRH